MIKKIGSHIALLLLTATFNTHKTHAMEPNPQQMLFELCNAPVTPETLAQIESLCKEGNVDLDFFYPDARGTLLMLAATEDNCPVIHILLKYGANINAATSNGFTALIIAAHHESIDAFNCLLENTLIAINQTTLRGYTALMAAAIKNNCPMIQTLLQRGAEINKTATKGATALILATERGNIDAVQCLVSNPNLAINQQDDEGNTALMTALFNKHTLTTKLMLIQRLLDAGADPEIADNDGLTPLQIAQEIGDPEILRLIYLVIQSKSVIEKHKKTAGAA